MQIEPIGRLSEQNNWRDQQQQHGSQKREIRRHCRGDCTDHDKCACWNVVQLDFETMHCAFSVGCECLFDTI